MISLRLCRNIWDNELLPITPPREEMDGGLSACSSGPVFEISCGHTDIDSTPPHEERVRCRKTGRHEEREINERSGVLEA